MFFDVEPSQLRQAKTPHELSLFNLMFFHLLLGAGTVVVLLTRAEILQDLGGAAYLLPLSASLSVIGLIHFRAHQARQRDPWLIAAHWQIAMRRSRLLLIAYGLTGLVIGAGFLVASGVDKKAMQDIILTIASRIGAVPTLLMVMVSFVLESGSQIGRAHV
jgi:hypothetical protein